VKERLGGFHSARCVMYSVDFAGVEAPMREGRWDRVAAVMIDAAKKLEASGAECVLIATNTVHRVADEVEASLSVPLLHIVDAAAAALQKKGIGRTGLLGTRFTMEEPFYRERLARHGIETVVPGVDERTVVHDIIFKELVLGSVLSLSRDRTKEIMAGLTGQGAEGIILGCTELPLLVKPEDAAVPLFDTTELHVRAAVDWALGLSDTGR